jgi:hypothetical protein
MIAVTSVGAGCASTVSHPSAATPSHGTIPTLEFLASFVIPATPATSVVNRARFGNLSGLSHDARTGRYPAVSDDRQPARVAWLDIVFAGGALSVTAAFATTREPRR